MAFLPAPSEAPGLPLVSGLGAGLCGVSAAYCIALRQRYSVTFHPDAIDIAMVFRHRRVTKADVAGWEHSQNDGSWGGVISLELRNGKSVELPLARPNDPEIEAWFAGIPNLEAERIANSMDELLADARFGASPEKRFQTLTHERRVAAALTWIGIGTAFWVGFLPRPYDLAIIVALLLPVIAYCLAVPLNGRWNFAETRAGDQRPGIAMFYIPPVFALLLRIFDYRIVDHARLLLFGCIFALAAWALLNLLRRTTQWVSLGQASLLFLFAIYSYAAAALINVRLAPIGREDFRAEVIASEYDGEDATLTLAPWGPYTGTYEADVARWAQAKTPAGTMVNVYLYTGPLGARWWLIGIRQD
jgi:hypothetical protein